MPGTVCSNCGGTDIEYDTARGDVVCTGCGTVLEDNVIVSEVTFQEQSSGSSSLVGQFVSNESGGGPRGNLSGSSFHHGLNRDSREITLQQAKKRLSHLGSLLKLNQHCIDTAFGFFKMALQLNLTRGRKSSIMDTACLYLVCRSEGMPHMLLDFSDVLQINVYSLGRAYLKLSTALHINPPAIDPCLYIHRFAHKLEFGDKVHDVSMTALRLVARMKRDWIHHGRRPAGLCGASLLVASRLHNFNRSVKEVARVVKLSEGTIRKRLGDFKDTPSSRLSIEEFLKIDLEQEHDPPCFLEAKKKAKSQATASIDRDQNSSSAMEGGEGGVSEEDIEGQDDGSEGPSAGFGGIKVSSVEEIIAKARVAEAFLNIPNAGLSGGSLLELAELAANTEQESEENPITTTTDGEGTSSSVITSTTEESLQEDNGELDTEGISDGEIEQMLLSEDEVKIKTQLWFADNADYLRELEVKRERQAALAGDKSTRIKKKPIKKRVKKDYTPASSAGEAIERMLVEKKISSKINYDVLRDLDKAWQGGGSECMTTSSEIGILQNEPLSSDTIPSSSRVSITGGGVSRLPSLRKRNSSQLYTLKDHQSPVTKTPKITEAGDSSSTLIHNETDFFQASKDILASEREAIMSREVIKESGPIQYDDPEEEEEEDRWEGGEIEEYEGDPLLHSDYEDDDDY